MELKRGVLGKGTIIANKVVSEKMVCDNSHLLR
jgi:hypothetical protein